MVSRAWKLVVGTAFGVGLFMVLAPASAGSDPTMWTEAGGVVGIPGERFEGGIVRRASADRAHPLRQDSSAPIALEMILEPVSLPQRDRSEERKIGVPRQVGIHRQIPAAWRVPIRAKELVWEPVAGGGEVATLSVTSPGAVSLRLAIDFERLPDGAEVRFYSPHDPSDAVGPFESAFILPGSRKRDSREPDSFWSPVIQSETIAMEIFVPEWKRGQDVVFSIESVSHIDLPLEPGLLKGPGDSGSCNRNLSCSAKWQNSGDAVAMYVFESGGKTLQCTGQLIVDGDAETQKPWFLTAAHCLRKKSEAKSMTFFFFYQQAGCSGGSFPMDQLGGGAKLKATTGGGGVTKGDHTLVLLKKAPPAGVFFQGISIAGDHVGSKKGASVGHPLADHKKIALLKKIDRLVEIDAEGFILDGGTTHYEVRWKKRTTTEEGSSGSSLMVGRRWPNQFVIGVLTGGFASCDDTTGRDFYGCFQYVLENFPKFAKRLRLN